ncbi:response regulator transcription factor [bacterium]|nr:response regulator transcription factor [bacterium]
MMKTKILLADDHAILREGLRSLFSNHPDMEVVGEAPNGISVRQKAQILAPDVILMDINMPELNGMATTQLIKQQFPDMHIIGLSIYCERQFILGMLGAGASGYLIKSNAFQDIRNAIQLVLKGYIVLGQEAQMTVFKDYQRILTEKCLLKSELSETEQKVIYGLSAGKSILQLAGDLEIDTDEVEKLQTRFVRDWISMS